MHRCPDVIGTYYGQVELIFPEHQMQRSGGYYVSTTSCFVDLCMVQEILDLWSCGVVTTGSCCGHGINEGIINVMEKDAQKMLELGYQFADIPYGCWPYTFKPKSKHNHNERGDNDA